MVQGSKPIAFRQISCQLAEQIRFTLPSETMLAAVGPRRDFGRRDRGAELCAVLVEGGYAAREERIAACSPRCRTHLDRGRMERRPRDAHEAEINRSCYGDGHGFFEYQFNVSEQDIAESSESRCSAKRRPIVRILRKPIPSRSRRRSACC